MSLTLETFGVGSHDKIDVLLPRRDSGPATVSHLSNPIHLYYLIQFIYLGHLKGIAWALRGAKAHGYNVMFYCSNLYLE